MHVCSVIKCPAKQKKHTKIELFSCKISSMLQSVVVCLQCVAVCCSVLQCVAVCCNVKRLRCTKSYFEKSSWKESGNTLQHNATHCNALQHTATHCNTLQHTATHCNTLQHTATHCSTLQHTATHCKHNTLQHTALVFNREVLRKLGWGRENTG